MRLSTPLHRKLLVLVLATLAISAVAAGPARAGKRPRGGSQTGTCWVTPNPVSTGAQYWVSGSGFAPGISVEIHTGGAVFFGTTNATGSFSAWDWGNFLYSGNQTVYVYRMGDSRRTVLATCSFYAIGLF